jgi:hypothetical protein
MKTILSIFAALLVTVTGFAQSSTLTINTVTGQINVPAGSAVPNFTTLKVGSVTITPVNYGTGVATWLATPSSANLAAAVTGETGSGALVFGTSPDFTTGITVGGVAVPTISSASTLTNKTISLASNTLGQTTVGANIFTLANPGAVTWLRVNADNTVTARSAANTRLDLEIEEYVSILAVDQTLNNSTTMTDLTGVTVTLPAGTFEMECLILVNSASTNPGMKTGWTSDQNINTMLFDNFGEVNNVVFNNVQIGTASSSFRQSVSANPGFSYSSSGRITTSTTTIVKLQFSQFSSHADLITAKAGSYIRARRTLP